jgi:hypothetical protein
MKKFLAIFGYTVLVGFLAIVGWEFVRPVSLDTYTNDVVILSKNDQELIQKIMTEGAAQNEALRKELSGCISAGARASYLH